MFWALFLLQAAQIPTLQPGNHTLSLRVGDRNRRYIVHVPPEARESGPLPVILSFHGGGGTAKGQQDYAGADPLADREGIVMVYPEGTGVLPRRLHTWNAGSCCGYARDHHVDDQRARR